MNDMIHYAMQRAVKTFGDKGDNIFSNACLSSELCKITNISGVIDGEIIKAITAGRPDVEPLSGGSHFKLIEAGNS